MDSVPHCLKLNKAIRPMLNRSIELENINPIVSYYCKIYVLEHILSNKIHLENKEIEAFTIELLDKTESLKNSDDEDLRNVLGDKTSSLSIVLTFAYKIYNSCLESFEEAENAPNKTQLIHKVQACLNFMALVTMIASDDSASIDFGKVTGGKIVEQSQFLEMHNEKIKLLKRQLYMLSKKRDDSDKDLERELEDELDKLQVERDQSFNDEYIENDSPFEVNEPEIGSADTASLEHDAAKEYGRAKVEEGSELGLPAAPRLSPGAENDDLNLPKAPTFLGDSNIAAINQNSSIQVIPPSVSNNVSKEVPTDVKNKAYSQSSMAHDHEAVHLTRHNLSSFVDRADQIAKVQKMAKFAISALNYEDLETAENELTKALSIIKSLKSNSDI